MTLEDDPCQCVKCRGQQPDYDTMINNNGFVVIWVTDYPPFCYTVGLTESKYLPELFFHGIEDKEIVYSLVERLIIVMETSSDLIKNGEIPNLCSVEIDGFEKKTSVGFLEVPSQIAVNICGIDRERYEDRFELRQVVLPDRNGHLPWHEAFDEGASIQAQQILGIIPTTSKDS